MERRSYSHRVVFIALALSLLAALGTALLIYQKYVKTTPKAASHLPAQVESALRLDVEQVVSYEPFRVHLLQVFETGREGPEPRVKHLERKTTLELGIDSREIVFARLPHDAWLILLGGVFRRDGVLDGAAALLRDEGEKFEVKGDLLVHANGHAFGVSDDGTLVLGSNEQVARDALPATEVSDSDYRAALQTEGTIAGMYQASGAGSFQAFLQPGKSFPGSGSFTHSGSFAPELLEPGSLGTLFLNDDARSALKTLSAEDQEWQLSREEYAASVELFATLLRGAVFQSQK